MTLIKQNITEIEGLTFRKRSVNKNEMTQKAEKDNYSMESFNNELKIGSNKKNHIFNIDSQQMFAVFGMGELNELQT